MARIRLSRELVNDGLGPTELASLVRRGQLVRVRRGAYCEPAAQGDDRSVAHRLLMAATVRQVSPEAVISHESAAVLHGLPTWGDLSRVELTRDRAGGVRRTDDLHLRGLLLDQNEIVELAGFRVTSVARTVLDLACVLPMEKSVAVGDAALRCGLGREELDQVLARAQGRHGVPAARRAIAFLDPRSESPGESFSRVLLHRRGLPSPEPQFLVRAPSGTVVGRCDFGWPELGTLGELDGLAKYGRLLRPGHRPEEVVVAEKRREDALRDLGWQVVRWIWADLYQPGELVARVQRAFERGRRNLP